VTLPVDSQGRGEPVEVAASEIGCPLQRGAGAVELGDEPVSDPTECRLGGPGGDREATNGAAADIDLVVRVDVDAPRRSRGWAAE
jgi:hypothetical protein